MRAGLCRKGLVEFLYSRKSNACPEAPLKKNALGYRWISKGVCVRLPTIRRGPAPTADHRGRESMPSTADHEISARAAFPVIAIVMRAAKWRAFPMAGPPDISAAVPIIKPADPDVIHPRRDTDGLLDDIRRRRLFNNHRAGRRRLNHHWRRRRRWTHLHKPAIAMLAIPNLAAGRCGQGRSGQGRSGQNNSDSFC